MGAFVIASLVVLVLKNNGSHTFQEASAAAIGCDYCKFGCFEAAATAAAFVSALAHASQAEPVACALKKLAVKKAQQAAAAAAAAYLEMCSVIVALRHVFAFCWTLLEMVCCIWGGIFETSGIWIAGFGILLMISHAAGKELWSVSGKWKKQSSLNGQEKCNDGSLLQASTQVDVSEIISFKGWDGHDCDTAGDLPHRCQYHSAARVTAGFLSDPGLSRRENGLCCRLGGKDKSAKGY